MDARGNAWFQILAALLPLQGNPERRFLASGLSLVAANLIPLAGVFLFGWLPGTVLMMYWFESAIVAFYNVLKMLSASIFAASGRFEPEGIAGGALISVFFTVHFGIFMLVHGVFLLGLMTLGLIPGPAEWVLTGSQMFTPSGAIQLVSTLLSNNVESWTAGPFIGIAALFVSHGISFVFHFLRGKQYIPLRTTTLMMQPYSRIIVMQITIIAGVFVLAGALKVGWPGSFFVAVLVMAKTIVDLRAHFKEHSQRPQMRPPE